MDGIPLLGPTRSQVVRLLRRESRTAVRVAAELDIQVSAARKHLDRLKEMGIVTERFESRGPGRPKKLYSLTDEGQELFPRRYDTVLGALLAKLVARHGDKSTEAVLEGVALDLAKSMGARPARDRAALSRIASGLDRLGFDVVMTRHAGVCTVTSANCPILKTATLHRELVCRGLHAEIIRAATNAPSVERGKWIVDGDPVCTHSFAVPAGARGKT